MDRSSLTYTMNSRGAENGRAILRRLGELCDDPRGSNDALLMKILRDNADTEYGRKYNFAGIKSVEDYRRNVPVITFEDIDGYIERMKAGERNVLTAYNYNHFNETSGTVGKRKSIPLTDEQSDVFMRYSNQLTLGILAEGLEDGSWMEGRSFCTSQGSHRKLDCGLTIGSASSIMAEACHGGRGQIGAMLKAMYTSPPETMDPRCGSDTQYLLVRFALMDRDVTGMTSGFIPNLCAQLKYIHDNYEMLIDDIEKGTVDPSIEIADSMRDSLMAKIHPMPERAAELRKVFANGADFPFVKDVWPRMQYYSCAGGDGFSVYDDTFERRYAGGRIHRVFSGITASEGLWTVPVRLDELSSVIVPDSAYFEFQPVEYGDDYSHVVSIDELELGRTYEFVITNLCGYYRYRMSDAVKVVGFWHNTALVQFMYRVNKTINILGEKTTEYALRLTAENTARRLGFDLIDYEVYPDTTVSPPVYRFLIEAEDGIVDRISKEELDRVVFEEIGKANSEFLEGTDTRVLAKPDAWFESPETQLLYMDKMAYLGASANQIKPVHVISNEDQRRFFMGMRNMWPERG